MACPVKVVAFVQQTGVLRTVARRARTPSGLVLQQYLWQRQKEALHHTQGSKPAPVHTLEAVVLRPAPLNLGGFLK